MQFESHSGVLNTLSRKLSVTRTSLLRASCATPRCHRTETVPRYWFKYATMACCSTCSSICFDALPEIPGIIKRLTADSEEESPLQDRDIPLLIWGFSFKSEPKDSSQFGFPYHENLEVLAASANSCSLCALVHRSVGIWIDIMTKRNDPFRAESHYPFPDLYTENLEWYQSPVRYFDPSGHQLWLCKERHEYRCPGAKGFLVFVQRLNDRGHQEVEVLARIGFAVDPGITPLPK